MQPIQPLSPVVSNQAPETKSAISLPTAPSQRLQKAEVLRPAMEVSNAARAERPYDAAQIQRQPSPMKMALQAVSENSDTFSNKREEQVLVPPVPIRYINALMLQANGAAPNVDEKT